MRPVEEKGREIRKAGVKEISERLKTCGGLTEA
jgi:hypothetical protein